MIGFYDKKKESLTHLPQGCDASQFFMSVSHRCLQSFVRKARGRFRLCMGGIEFAAEPWTTAFGGNTLVLYCKLTM
jgi:hypothetical protein